MVSYSQSTASIAVWNLNGWGGVNEDRLERQAEGLSLLDAELVVLVEVPSEDALGFLRQRLADRAGLDYHALFLPQHGDLHIGLLYKAGVTVDNATLLDGSDLGDTAKRKALVAEVTIGKFDFTLIAVHLKSGRELENQKIRDEQCTVIGQFITDLRGEANRNPDILLVGDFNMIPGQDISNFHHLGGDDLIDFLSSWDLQDRYSHILSAGRANLLDGFAISRRYSTEYIRGSLRLFPMHWTMEVGRERFRRDVSDHLPFIADFRIDRDRD